MIIRHDDIVIGTHKDLPFNTGVDGLRHYDFIETETKHLSLRDGLLSTYLQKVADSTLPVEMRIRNISLISGEEMGFQSRVQPAQVVEFSQREQSQVEIFTELALVNLLGTHWQPMFTKKILMLVMSKDMSYVVKIEPDPAKARSILSLPGKQSYRKDALWGFIS